MSIKIADCSLRDGGYVGNKNFPSKTISGIIKGLVDSGIDYIETGFLQNNSSGERLVYHNSVDAMRFLPKDKKSSKFVGFCDNSRYSVSNLDDYNKKSFCILKLSFAKHELDDALQFAIEAKKKGYKVFFQPMDAPSYSFQERKEMIKKVNKIRPEAFAIVDTFGVMHLDDLESIFNQVNRLLDKKIKIALHTHNNLGIANALVERFARLCDMANRDGVVDGSLLGMARGAGNSCTEVIASYLNKNFKRKYNIPSLIDTIEKYIVPIKENSDWGYSVPMLICGIEHAHVDNVKYLSTKKNLSNKDVYQIIDSMDINLRIRYGSNYKKDDFSDLELAYKKYKNNK